MQVDFTRRGMLRQSSGMPSQFALFSQLGLLLIVEIPASLGQNPSTLASVANAGAS